MVSLIDNRLRSPSRTSRWEPTTTAPLRHRIVSRFYSYFSARFGTVPTWSEKDKRVEFSVDPSAGIAHTSGSRSFALSTDSRGNSWIRPLDRWCACSRSQLELTSNNGATLTRAPTCPIKGAFFLPTARDSMLLLLLLLLLVMKIPRVRYRDTIQRIIETADAIWFFHSERRQVFLVLFLVREVCAI